MDSTVDILIPVHGKEVEQAAVTLESLILHSDMPNHRVVFLMHGGPRETFRPLDNIMARGHFEGRQGEKVEFKWMLRHNRHKLSWVDLLAELARLKRNRMAVLAKPGIIVNDKEWFGKMQRPFLMDRTTMVTIANKFSASAAQPQKLRQHAHVDGPLSLWSIDMPLIFGNVTRGEAMFGQELDTLVKKYGGSRWSVESVRYTTASKITGIK